MNAIAPTRAAFADDTREMSDDDTPIAAGAAWAAAPTGPRSCDAGGVRGASGRGADGDGDGDGSGGGGDGDGFTEGAAGGADASPPPPLLLRPLCVARDAPALTVDPAGRGRRDWAGAADDDDGRDAEPRDRVATGERWCMVNNSRVTPR